MQIRDAVEADLPAIVAIYNAAIPSRNSTADLFPITVESRRDWFFNHNPERRPLWVLTLAEEIVAWIGLSSFYGGRPAYDATAEISIYIAPEHQGKGYGSLLVSQMLEAAPRLGVTTFLAIYFDHNQASRKLFHRFGFKPMGHLPAIAELDGIRRGVIIAGWQNPA
ncbi:MAG: GNAT family N-acetyltransferase [Leptolyngbya sp. IPPAS B-1204]|uniref:N-acetyltransferase n=1 Tax=Leptolyngbya sp. NK1-12 TaxID=2547451 RepID=A0AA97APW9_9CYAN|nr:GNAT family N-acetyltransferase [Leptolyngbya sp. NK1-12]MBF2050680.1 N-acetyltransferase [Elainella sp. C42_A2020_010]RNJ70524.1 MAG: N-acetyltransferase [Leptolyngbya sp. IPPAS B-1204]WNZ22413.1 N-acetyltransferase [Leptolyngbya sp. NK1-12]